MGKKRKIMYQGKKFASKYHAHPALATNKTEAADTQAPAEAKAETPAAPAPAPAATPQQAKKEAPKVKKTNPFKNLAKKTTTKKTDKE